MTFDFGGTDTTVGFDCRTLIEDEAVLLIIPITSLRDVGDQRVKVDDLLEASGSNTECSAEKWPSHHVND